MYNYDDLLVNLPVQFLIQIVRLKKGKNIRFPYTM